MTYAHYRMPARAAARGLALTSALAALAATGAPGAAMAADAAYPVKPIRLVVPFPAGVAPMPSRV
ncbi:hypothetical protein [Pigmentiphaga litoralis]|uniref:hypothetical protein n=1 Tax=Pigmentiphaga litoralis TaxID=516702 RepID=UPI003B431615